MQQYFAFNDIEIDFYDFAADILLTTLCAYLLAKIYERFGRNLSNRSVFAQNFIILALTTMMVITIVKSSLALSLGLVGALSIVRFRSAIKDPEELTYLFLSISLGLGFGAGHRYLTLLFFTSICLVLIVKARFFLKSRANPLFLLIRSSKKLEITKLTGVIKKHAHSLDLQRFDTNKEGTEAIFNAEPLGEETLDLLIKEIKELDGGAEISFSENKGWFN